MNDGDLGQSIDRHVTQSEKQAFTGASDNAYLDPSRWWFASSAFPMIAGTLGPVASAFSICALVRPWRQRLLPGGDVDNAEFISDPSWLLIVNALQLTVAILSNISLLLNMARKVRFSIAQPITIVGWYISSICLIALNASAAGPLLDLVPNPQQIIWSQAFFYGMFAAILYFVVATLMLATVLGANAGYYQKDFQLTTSQRTLMLQTILVLMYLLVGAVVFSHIEDWAYLDTVYWADVTLFTVGFGDFHVTTDLGRALLIPYALVGVISLGLVIGSIRSLVLERGRRQLDTRMVEKERRRLIRSMTKRGKDKVLTPIPQESQTRRAPQPFEQGHDQSQDANPETYSDETYNSKTEFERRSEEFALMRKIQHRASVRRKWMAMAISTGSWFVLWFVGAKIFQEAEAPYQGWTYGDGFYFTFVALTTIGYGDRTPVSPCGKAFFVFWSLLALPTMTVLISNAGDTVVSFVRDVTLVVGNITILPGEAGVINNLKHFISRLACGMVFSKHYYAAAILENKGRDNDDDRDDDKANSTAVVRRKILQKSQQHLKKEKQKQIQSPPLPSSLHQSARHHYTDPETVPSSPLSTETTEEVGQGFNLDAPLPTGSALHYLLIVEISNVARHHMSSGAQQSPPRRYTFQEWAWYLRLIGEDEGSADTHRKAKHPPRKSLRIQSRQPTLTSRDTGEDETMAEPNPQPDDKTNALGDHNDTTASPERPKWSWVGHQSPLLGSMEESEWILERLTARLRAELGEVAFAKSSPFRSAQTTDDE